MFRGVNNTYAVIYYVLISYSKPKIHPIQIPSHSSCIKSNDVQISDFVLDHVVKNCNQIKSNQIFPPKNSSLTCVSGFSIESYFHTHHNIPLLCHNQPFQCTHTQVDSREVSPGESGTFVLTTPLRPSVPLQPNTHRSIGGQMSAR